MSDNKEVMFMLGEIRGQLEGMNKRLDKVDSIESRLRHVERKSAVHGAVAGGFMSVGVTVLVQSIREALRTHGS